MGLPRAGTPTLLRDVDGDGDVDILIAADPTAGLYLNDGKGGFTRKPGPLTDFLVKRCPYLHRVQTTDLDNDGDVDLVVSNRRYGQEQVFENRGGGEFALALPVKRGWVDSVAICDIDGDGRLDVLVGVTGKDKIGTVNVYLNKTPNVGNFSRLHLQMAKPNPCALGARAEIFAAGTLGRKDSRPIWVEDAHPNATPIQVGLGKAAQFDLRVTFPGGVVRQWKNVKAKPDLYFTPKGSR